MGRYVDKDNWEEEILIPDTHTPILGGQPVWEGDRLVDGFANVSPAMLADRTRHLKNKIDAIEIGIDSNFDNFMRKDENLSGLEDIQQAKYNLELNLVDNTRDLDKPISNATQEALDEKVDLTDPRLTDSRTPKGPAGGVLSGSYPNPTFAVDMATQAELDAVADAKVDKVAGKGLSDENYTLAEKNKLGGIEAGAQVNTVTSVAGKTGAITLNKTDVGLSNVDNTSDSNKPVSAAQQAALDLKLNADANAVSASKLATPRTISLSGDASGSTSFDGSANATIVVQVADDSHNHVISNVDGLQSALDSKVDKVTGKQLSDENYTLAEKNKLAGVATGATKNATDAQLRDRTTHTGEQPISTVSGLQSELDSKANTTYVNTQLATKVDKVAGKGLSTNDFTDQLRDKLAALESSHFRGTFPSKGDLEIAIPVAEAGDYADVDTEGQDAERYIWDISDSKWVLSTTKPAPLTAAQIKQMYESNPDTNPFDDAAKAKLGGIAAGATKNATDAQLRDRSTHTGTQPISTVSGLQSELDSKADITYTDTQLATKVDKVAGKGLSDENYTLAEKNKLAGVAVEATKNATDAQLRDRSTHTGTQPISTVSGLEAELSDKVSISDTRLTNSREWTASTVTQAEAEAGTATTRRAWTAQRVRQAIVAWWNGSADKTKLDGIEVGATKNATDAQLRDRSTHTGTQAISTIVGLTDSLSSKADQTSLDAVAAAKVDKVSGKGLSTNDYTTAEKNKLNGIQAGAQVNSITTVNGKTGAVTLTYTDVDAAPTSHTHLLSQITDAGNLASLSTNDSTANFLRGDGTWATPPNTTYAEITTAEIDAGTASTLRTITGRRMKYALDKKADVVHTHTLSQITDAGDVAGISTNGSAANFLRGDGTWATPPNTNTTYEEITTSEIDAGTASTLRTITGRRMKYALDKKSDVGHGHVIDDITGLQAAIDSKANTSTQVIAGTGLSGGGTLTSNRTLSVVYGTAAGTAAEGNDSRLSNSREWTASTVTQAEAEAGTATTRRAWTAQRVRQAILGWWNSSTEKAKLDGIATGATKNATDAQLRDRATHTGVQPISSVDGLQSAIDGKVDNDDARLTNAREWTASAVSQAEAEAGTATTARKWTAQRVRQAILGWWNSSAEKTKLDGIETGATKNATDAQLRDRSTHTGTQAISTVSGLQTALNAKVDKVTGMGLSQENFTTAEKNKLASLESSKFKGQFSSFAALQSAFPTADVGSYAYVDQGAGKDVVKYIWDSSDTKWVLQQGESSALTPSEVKSLYESNADTNAFTNSEKSKLAGIEPGAQVNVGTNLAMGGSGNSRTITSSTGNNVSVPVATTSAAGFMSTTDKSKLDGLSNVNLIAGSNVSLSGAYPNITISSTNTTYSEISEAEVTAGTASTARAISARRLKFAVDTHGLKIGTTSTTAKAGNWTPAWGDVSGKPTTFTPAAHNHSAGEITSGVLAYARIPTIRHGDTNFANQDLNTSSNVQHATVRTGGAVDDGTNSLQVVGGTRTDTLAAGGVQSAEESIDTDGNIQVRGEGQLKMGDFTIQYNATTQSLDFNFMGN